VRRRVLAPVPQAFASALAAAIEATSRGAAGGEWPGEWEASEGVVQLRGHDDVAYLPMAQYVRQSHGFAAAPAPAPRRASDWSGRSAGGGGEPYTRSSTPRRQKGSQSAGAMARPLARSPPRARGAHPRFVGLPHTRARATPGTLEAAAASVVPVVPRTSALEGGLERGLEKRLAAPTPQAPTPYAPTPYAPTPWAEGLDGIDAAEHAPAHAARAARAFSTPFAASPAVPPPSAHLVFRPTPDGLKLVRSAG
jgi:hypothetical protein